MKALEHNCNVILIDDERAVRESLVQAFELEGFKAIAFEDAESALELLKEDWHGVIISDINMPKMDGIQFLKESLDIDSELAVIMLTGHGDISMAVESMRLGAYDFLEKPFKLEHLIERVTKAFEKRELVLENRELRAEIDAQSGPGPRIFGNSPQIREIRRQLMQIKDARANVIISGESGTGKELAARFLHDHSIYHDHPFILIKCDVIAEGTIEEALHDIISPQLRDLNPGLRLEHTALKPTLMLYEVEKLSHTDQSLLERFLDDQFANFAHSLNESKFDFRLVSTTRENLLKMVELGKFREDLYYRLNLIEIEMPSLRERQDDIPLLFQNYLRMASSRYGLPTPRVTSLQLSWLRTYDWPGNVRELRNIAERFLLLGDKTVFSSDAGNEEKTINLSLTEQVKRFEKTVLQSALFECRGHLKKVQRQLNIPRKTLYEKMRKHGLEKSEYK